MPAALLRPRRRKPHTARSENGYSESGWRPRLPARPRAPSAAPKYPCRRTAGFRAARDTPQSFAACSSASTTAGVQITERSITLTAGPLPSSTAIADFISGRSPGIGHIHRDSRIRLNCERCRACAAQANLLLGRKHEVQVVLDFLVRQLLHHQQERHTADAVVQIRTAQHAVLLEPRCLVHSEITDLHQLTRFLGVLCTDVDEQIIQRQILKRASFPRTRSRRACRWQTSPEYSAGHRHTGRRSAKNG